MSHGEQLASLFRDMFTTSSVGAVPQKLDEDSGVRLHHVDAGPSEYSEELKITTPTTGANRPDIDRITRRLMTLAMTDSVCNPANILQIQ